MPIHLYLAPAASGKTTYLVAALRCYRKCAKNALQNPFERVLCISLRFQP